MMLSNNVVQSRAMIKKSGTQSLQIMLHGHQKVIRSPVLAAVTNTG